MSGNQEVYKNSMNQGHSAAWDQDWVQAANYYQRALKEFPRDAKALNSLGLAQFESANFEAAYRTYLLASQVSQQDPLPLEKLGQISELLGNTDELIRCAMRAAELYQEEGNRAKAVENLIRVTRSQAENLAAHSRLAYLYESQGNQKQAATEYLAVASLLQYRGDEAGAAQAAAPAATGSGQQRSSPGRADDPRFRAASQAPQLAQSS